MNLWKSDDCKEWQAALDSYADVIRAQNVKGLEEVDEWYRGEFPRLLAGRDPAFVTREELEQAARWKMKRGVWRERNRLLVISNPAGEVRKAARAAFAAIPDPRLPVALLSELKGVGPATSSAVLAASRPDLYPFFDELVAAQIPGLGPTAFTAAYYQRYAARLRERAAELDRACGQGLWTAHAVGQALWAASGGKVAQ
jgi:hypothetical protein